MNAHTSPPWRLQYHESIQLLLTSFKHKALLTHINSFKTSLPQQPISIQAIKPSMTPTNTAPDYRTKLLCLKEQLQPSEPNLPYYSKDHDPLDPKADYHHLGHKEANCLPHRYHHPYCHLHPLHLHLLPEDKKKYMTRISSPEQATS